MAVREARGEAINLRPAPDLAQRIVALARKEKRSVNNMALWLLHTHPLLQSSASNAKLNGHAHKVVAPAV